MKWRSALFSFLKRTKTDPKAMLMKVLGEYTLPSFPSTVMKILQRIRNPESSAASISEVLALDPGLSVRVLSIANSAAFSPSKKVENLTQAVALVGLSQLESLVLSIGVATVMPRDPVPAYDMKRFWRASARRGVLAQELAALLCPARQSECFTAGFLQDMALPFLVAHRPQEYESILHRWKSEGGDLSKLEREVFDWDHAEVATWICSEWALPEAVASPIGGHHGANQDAYECLTPVSLVALLGENGNVSGVNALAQQANSHHGIKEERVKEMIASSFEAAEDLTQLMS